MCNRALDLHSDVSSRADSFEDRQLPDLLSKLGWEFGEAAEACASNRDGESRWFIALRDIGLPEIPGANGFEPKSCGIVVCDIVLDNDMSWWVICCQLESSKAVDNSIDVDSSTKWVFL